MREPENKRTWTFVDGQNLFHAVKSAFGYSYPNYDIAKLAAAVSQAQGWTLTRTSFYTGVPDASDNPRWNRFWTNKLLRMSRQGIHTFSRALRYRNQTIALPDGTQHVALVGQEKGIDVRLALDVVRGALRDEYDVALVFSQDQDLSELADEVRTIATQQDRWIEIASAFPVSPTSSNKRGINKTDWIQITRAEYDRCIDPNDYR
jgi:uncharacterized LabA/DUF88 family protein